MTKFNNVKLFNVANEIDEEEFTYATYIYVGYNVTEKEKEKLSEMVWEEYDNALEDDPDCPPVFPGDLMRAKYIIPGWYYQDEGINNHYQWRHIYDNIIDLIFILRKKAK